ncbi:8664_t:CDS:2 [Cetraspora pellucida]|uniref:8664_t:CDS:1 n=1 Tax=Cetraspora pellucida TaxID=1433469 RepID=A0ACA9KDZ8_9GLOM|nr:8664_t:CDS:2 [Cetraspora pellucida]
MPPVEIKSDHRATYNKNARKRWSERTAEQKIARNKKIRERRESQTLEEQFNKRLERRRKDKSSHRNLLCFEQRHVIGDMIHACHYCGARSINENRITTEIRDGYTNEARSKTITQRQYFAYLLQWRPLISHALHYTGRLFQQFIVDAYVTIEQSRLNWVSQNQIQIRAELYQDDILHCSRHTTNNSSYNSIKDVENYALLHLQSILRVQGRSLDEFPPMPLPYNVPEEPNRLIREELDYNIYFLTRFCEINENNLNRDHTILYHETDDITHPITRLG